MSFHTYSIIFSIIHVSLLLIMKKDQQPLHLTWFDCHMSCNKKFMLHMYTSSRFGSLNDMLSWLISDLVTMFSTNKLLYTHIPKMSIVSSDTIFCEIYFHASCIYHMGTHFWIVQVEIFQCFKLKKNPCTKLLGLTWSYRTNLWRHFNWRNKINWLWLFHWKRFKFVCLFIKVFHGGKKLH